MNDLSLGIVPTTLFQQLRDSLRLDQVTWNAARRGLTRYPRAVTLALLGSWSLFAFAIWVAVLLGIIGALIGFVGGANLGESVLQGSGSATGVLGGLLGALAGFALGFAAIMGTNILIGGSRILGSLFSGVILAAAATALLMFIEPWLMYFRGYRPPSNREELILNPVLRDVAGNMHLTVVPQILISDTRTPGAWTHTRHVVIAKRLLDLPPNQLGGILAHELHHWRSGDTTGLLFVSMCGLPLTIATNVIAYLGLKLRVRYAAFICSLLLWPYLLIARWMIQPLLAAEGRTYEYDADQAAVEAGYGQGLYLALEQLRPFEQARSGWEDVVNAAHPPMEYRLEAIEDELKYQQAGVRPVPPSYRVPGKRVIVAGNSESP